MKTILSSALAAVCCLAASLADAQPRIEHPVNDYTTDGVLSPADRERVAHEILQIRDQTAAQVAVLVVDSTDGVPIDDYALAAARAWDGGDRARQDGVLVTFAVRDRRSDVHTGVGVQDRVTDLVARRALDAARPALREGRYGDACVGVVRDIGAVLGARTAVVVPGSPHGHRIPTVGAAPAEQDYTVPMALFVLVAGGVGGGLFWNLRNQRRESEARRRRDDDEFEAAFAARRERERREREERAKQDREEQARRDQDRRREEARLAALAKAATPSKPAHREASAAEPRARTLAADPSRPRNTKSPGQSLGRPASTALFDAPTRRASGRASSAGDTFVSVVAVTDGGYSPPPPPPPPPSDRESSWGGGGGGDGFDGGGGGSDW